MAPKWTSGYVAPSLKTPVHARSCSPQMAAVLGWSPPPNSRASVHPEPDSALGVDPEGAPARVPLPNWAFAPFSPLASSLQGES